VVVRRKVNYVWPIVLPTVVEASVVASPLPPIASQSRESSARSEPPVTADRRQTTLLVAIACALGAMLGVLVGIALAVLLV
jgi:hypothetical protein